MPNDVEFQDNSMEVKRAIEQACEAWLEEAAGELESATKRNQTRVDTGQTKGSWTHKVDAASQKAVVGSPLENAIWEEFGTGEYALEGNGRKGGWTYKDVKGNWHRTRGKKPLRPLHKAFMTLKPKLQKALERKLKGLR